MLLALTGFPEARTRFRGTLQYRMTSLHLLLGPNKVRLKAFEVLFQVLQVSNPLAHFFQLPAYHFQETALEVIARPTAGPLYQFPHLWEGHIQGPGAPYEFQPTYVSL